ncbi:hypothetical protein C8Q70DRAFT_480560 [Cubamyces menziesii]|nr:hypothetical protein C8Q70DRAFT_480560 [Cubamyces menziesii]
MGQLLCVRGDCTLRRSPPCPRCGATLRPFKTLRTRRSIPAGATTGTYIHGLPRKTS